jgi:hypothetical protein
VRGTGAGFELSAELGNRFGRPFGDCLYVAVGQIPNIANNT